MKIHIFAMVIGHVIAHQLCIFIVIHFICTAFDMKEIIVDHNEIAYQLFYPTEPFPTNIKKVVYNLLIY